MFVSTNYRMNKADDVDVFISKFNEKNLIWSDLLRIDYFYHHHMKDYDNGLSFLDRIHKKLGQFHPEWNIDDLKNVIRNSNNPVIVYADIIKYMFDDARDIVYYGL